MDGDDRARATALPTVVGFLIAGLAHFLSWALVTVGCIAEVQTAASEAACGRAADLGRPFQTAALLSLLGIPAVAALTGRVRWIALATAVCLALDVAWFAWIAAG